MREPTEDEAEDYAQQRREELAEYRLQDQRSRPNDPTAGYYDIESYDPEDDTEAD